MNIPLGEWDWLEIAKLIASIFTPLAIVTLGVYVHRITKQFEHQQWRSQKLVEKRLAVYDDLAPHFSDMLCYFTYVGLWRDIDPPEIVALKRTMDKKIYFAKPLFSDDFFMACDKFQNLCFETFNGMGEDAKLKTAKHDRIVARANDWVEDWNHCFSRSITPPVEIRDAHNEIMRTFSIEIGIKQN